MSQDPQNGLKNEIPARIQAVDLQTGDQPSAV